MDSLYGLNQLHIAESILKESPDIVFICDYFLSDSKKLDSLLSKVYKRNYKSRTICVFYSKYEMDSIMEVFTSWYGRRHFQTVKTHVFRGKDTLTLIGCHLSSSHHHIKEGYLRRRKEANALYEHIKKKLYPVIVLGDLNDIPDSYTLYKIMKVGLSNAWWAVVDMAQRSMTDGFV